MCYWTVTKKNVGAFNFVSMTECMDIATHKLCHRINKSMLCDHCTSSDSCNDQFLNFKYTF